MVIENNIAKNVKIAYVGGGSRGWAWTLMKDLRKTKNMSGTVALYDIDLDAAKANETIGNNLEGSDWIYEAVDNIKDALTGADFVIVSILPATFDEMEYDVHSPEKYGIWQSVGDTAGAGGFMRALRTVPMIREIAAAVREYSPKAWVINYTNPMAVCMGALYREFPEIKAFGCCHEVFGTQSLLSEALADIRGIEGATRSDISVNVVGVNHFTWFSEANYKNIDLFDVYREFVDKYYETGYNSAGTGNWMNDSFTSNARVRMDLFRRFGYIAAAGDRHLAEFMDGEDYLASPEKVKEFMFGLTSVAWRKDHLVKRLQRSKRLLAGEETFSNRDSGEEGTLQMGALLGLGDMVTNVNLPNRGQIENLPHGAIVETNASFRADSLRPVFAGKVPDSIYPLIARASRENELILDACFSLDLAYARECFKKLNMLKKLTDAEKEELFNTMYEGTKEYLKDYKNNL